MAEWWFFGLFFVGILSVLFGFPLLMDSGVGKHKVRILLCCLE